MHELPVKNFATLFYGEVPNGVEEWCQEFLKKINNGSQVITPHVVKVWLEELHELDKYYQTSDIITIQHQMSYAEQKYSLNRIFKFLPAIMNKHRYSQYDIRRRRNVQKIARETIALISESIHDRIHPPEDVLLKIDSSNDRFWCEYKGSLDHLTELSMIFKSPTMVFQLRRRVTEADGPIYENTNLQKVLLSVAFGINNELCLFEEVLPAYQNDVKIFVSELKDQISIIDTERSHHSNSILIYLLYKETGIEMPLQYLANDEERLMERIKTHFKNNPNVSFFFNQIIFTFEVTDLYNFYMFARDEFSSTTLKQIDDLINKNVVKYKKAYTWDRVDKSMIMQHYGLNILQLKDFRDLYVNDYHLAEAFEKAIDLELQSDFLKQKVCSLFQIHKEGNVYKMDIKRHVMEAIQSQTPYQPLSINPWDILRSYFSSHFKRPKFTYTVEEEKQSPFLTHMPFLSPKSEIFTHELIKIINLSYTQEQIAEDFKNRKRNI